MIQGRIWKNVFFIIYYKLFTNFPFDCFFRFIVLCFRCRKSCRSHYWRRVHHLLREAHRFGAVRMRSHVHVLRMCDRTVARHWRRPVSTLSGRHSGRDSNVQIVGNLVIWSLYLSLTLAIERERKRWIVCAGGCAEDVRKKEEGCAATLSRLQNVVWANGEWSCLLG